MWQVGGHLALAALADLLDADLLRYLRQVVRLLLRHRAHPHAACILLEQLLRHLVGQEAIE